MSRCIYCGKLRPTESEYANQETGNGEDMCWLLTACDVDLAYARLFNCAITAAQIGKALSPADIYKALQDGEEWKGDTIG